MCGGHFTMAKETKKTITAHQAALSTGPPQLIQLFGTLSKSASLKNSDAGVL